MKTNTYFLPFFLSLAMICLPAFARADAPIKLVAKLSPPAGGNVTGAVTFTGSDSGTKVVVDISGLTPGKHGFHIHDKGDCSDPKFNSAGAHFNPTHSHHGGPATEVRHIGDFGNVETDASGKVHVELTDKNLKLTGADAIAGKSVIVHAGEDDLKTDPSGNSGDRVACGVIEVAK
jgi:Cu-Zn family superoxide dismutase